MILISEKENSYEKEVEERLRREITEEFQTEKERSRRGGSILSGIGGILYLIHSILLSLAFWGFNSINISFLIVGIISLVGIRIGVKKRRIGGIVILISIPISIVIGLIISDIPSSLTTLYGNDIIFIYIIYILLSIGTGIPFLPGVFVIIGGILFLISSDE